MVELIDKLTVILTLPVPVAALQAVVSAVAVPAAMTLQVHVAAGTLIKAGLSVSATVTEPATAGPEFATSMV